MPGVGLFTVVGTGDGMDVTIGDNGGPALVFDSMLADRFGRVDDDEDDATIMPSGTS